MKYTNELRSGSKNPLVIFLKIGVISTILIKIYLIGEGFLAYPDESRYAASLRALQFFSHFNIEDAISQIFSTQGRPFDTIVRTLPNLFQQISSYVFKLHIYESKNSAPLFLFNFFVYCLILLTQFKFSKLLLKNDSLALLCVLFYSVLTNSYIYLRHALPYDVSLLIFYYTLYLLTKSTQENNLTIKKSFIIGIISFLGFLTYPGYFPLYFFCFFIILFNNFNESKLFNKLYYAGSLGFGTIICLFVFELISRVGNGSYILDSLTLSKSITQGSFEETYVFFLKYLVQVEGVTGMIILISFLIFIGIVIKNFKEILFNKTDTIIIFGVLILGFYLAYASLGYFLHKFVYYGRLLHQYFPLLCIVSVYSIDSILKRYEKIKPPVFFLVALIIILNFGFNFIEYKSFAYPRDIAWILYHKYDLSGVNGFCEFANKDSVNSWSLIPGNNEIKEGKFAEKENMNLEHKEIIFVNSCFFWPVYDMDKYKRYDETENLKLMLSQPHFINFKAYQYEGYNVEERENLDRMNLQIKVFQRKNG